MLEMTAILDAAIDADADAREAKEFKRGPSLKKLRLITASDAPSEDVGSAAAAIVAESSGVEGGEGGAATKPASVVEANGGGTATLFQGGSTSAWDAAEVDVAAGNA